MYGPGWGPEQAGTLAVAVWTKECQRYSAACDGQKAIARTIKGREDRRSRWTHKYQGGGSEWMKQSGDSRRDEWMFPSQDEKLGKARCYLRRSYQGGGGNSLQGRCASSFE